MNQFSIGAEAIDVPAMHQQTFASDPFIPSEISLPTEPSVPDISGIIPSVENTEMMPEVPQTPMSLDVPPMTPLQQQIPQLSQHIPIVQQVPQIPQLQPSEVSSFLGTAEEQPQSTPFVTSSLSPRPDIDALRSGDMSQMENMGYDQVNQLKFS